MGMWTVQHQLNAFHIVSYCVFYSWVSTLRTRAVLPTFWKYMLSLQMEAACASETPATLSTFIWCKTSRRESTPKALWYPKISKCGALCKIIMWQLHKIYIHFPVWFRITLKSYMSPCQPHNYIQMAGPHCSTLISFLHFLSWKKNHRWEGGCHLWMSSKNISTKCKLLGDIIWLFRHSGQSYHGDDVRWQ
jgi:hypothetical protein